MSKDEIVLKERAILSNLLKRAKEGNGEELVSLITKYSTEHHIPCYDVVLQFRDANQRSAIHFACCSPSSCSEGKTDIIQYLLNQAWVKEKANELFGMKDTESLTPLMMAASQTTNVERIKLILEINPKLASQKSSVGAAALHYAADAGAPPNMIKTLYEADNSCLQLFSTNSGAPIHWAVNARDDGNRDYIATLQALLQCGANVDLLNTQGITPLVLAAASEKDSIAAFLVQNGADGTIQIPGDVTAFHIAADLNLVQTLTALLKSSNNDIHYWVIQCTSMRNHLSQTPLDLATIAGNVDCVQLLLPPGNASKDQALEYIAQYKKKAPMKKPQKKKNPNPTNTTNEREKDSKIQSYFTTKDELQTYEKAKQIMKDFKESNLTKTEHEKAKNVKGLGNEYFSKKNWSEAIAQYSEAISIYPIDATFYSNRSAAYINLQLFNEALQDAVLCKTINPDWSKADFRLATSRLALSRYEDAAMAAWNGLQNSPTNEEMKSLLQKCVEMGKKAHLEKQKQ